MRANLPQRSKNGRVDAFFCVFCAFLWSWPLLFSFVAFGGEWRWGHKLTEDDDEDIGICNVAYVGFFGADG